MRGLLQLALDFLGEPAPAPAPRHPAATGRGGEHPREASHPPGNAAPPPLALPQHPQATHAVVLGGASIAYALVRAQRRSIGFSVSRLGLSVRAPARVPVHEIESILRKRAGWILRKLADAAAREAARVEPAWGDGATFPLLGQTATVRLHRAGRGAMLLRHGATAVPPADGDGTAGPVLCLPLAPDAPPPAIARAVRQWLQAEARRHFTERLAHFAAPMGVQWHRLALTSARTRWGSASTSGTIRLHWRLLHMRPQVLDYVVIHELAHLRHMDHSPRFWAFVATQCPDYRALRRELRTTQVPSWE